MSLSSPISDMPIWPPDSKTRFIEAAKPAGGYIRISDEILVSVLHAYQSKAYDLDWLGVRSWATAQLICHARLFGRRQRSGPGDPLLCKTNELMTNLGVTSRQRVRKAVGCLQRLGLLQMLANGDAFTVVSMPNHREIPSLEDRLCHLRATQKKRLVPVPRRVLQFIARKPNIRYGLTATMIGTMMRCLYLHRNICRSGGSCKASWIASQFQIETSTVQKAFKELKEMGWLIRYQPPHSYRQKHGNWTYINLHWMAQKCSVSHAQKQSVSSETKKNADITIRSSNTNRRYPTPELNTNRRYPDSYSDLSYEIEKYQNFSTATEDGVKILAPGDGALLTETMASSSFKGSLPPSQTASDEQLKVRRLIAQSLQQGGHRQVPETGPSRVDVMTEPYHSEPDSMALLGGSEFPEPKLKTVIPPHLKRSPASLNNIDLDDLCESQRLYELYEDAVERGWMPRGEAHMLFVFSAADHARHFRAGNPCGLFREIVQNNHRRLITDQEEDRARIRLREYLDQKRGLSAPKSEIEYVEPWVLSQASEDADTKQVVIFWEVLRQTGYKFYDEDHPFRLFKQTEYGHEWTRSRWEDALTKLKKECYKQRF